MLELQNLCFSIEDSRGKTEILRNIDLTLKDGTFAVLTGPNGGGKTTLARAVMGLVRPTSGKILWNGIDITHLSITERARLGVSYAFQQPPRFKGMTVRDLLSLAAGRETLTRAEECQYLNRVGLCAGDYIHREVDTSLSGGEVKRIEIATLLARHADLMIFDEPEAGIDLWSFARLTDTFHNLHRQNAATLLVISHQERILSLADEIVMIADGVITAHGPKDEIFPTILANTAGGCSFFEQEGDHD